MMNIAHAIALDWWPVGLQSSSNNYDWTLVERQLQVQLKSADDLHVHTEHMDTGLSNPPHVLNIATMVCIYSLHMETYTYYGENA